MFTGFHPELLAVETRNRSGTCKDMHQRAAEIEAAPHSSCILEQDKWQGWRKDAPDSQQQRWETVEKSTEDGGKKGAGKKGAGKKGEGKK